MARFALDRAIDVTTRGQRIQGAGAAVLWTPDILWAAISSDLVSSNYGITSDDFDQAAVIVTHSTTISSNNNSETLASWDTEPTNGDIRAFHSTATTSRLTVPTGYGGIYDGVAIVAFSGNSTGLRQVKVYTDGGTTLVGAASLGAPGMSSSVFLACPFSAVLTAGQYVEAKIVQVSGGALTFTPTQFWMKRVVRI